MYLGPKLLRLIGGAAGTIGPFAAFVLEKSLEYRLVTLNGVFRNWRLIL